MFNYRESTNPFVEQTIQYCVAACKVVITEKERKDAFDKLLLQGKNKLCFSYFQQVYMFLEGDNATKDVKFKVLIIIFSLNLQLQVWTLLF